ncbi:MAG: TetR/AcrR family transcriptional regulator [Gammaproteobacteria bacterium]|nr:MAG: TetR/AcrR family transcriptional regulator [Gammaproteobacteria bacterium]
MRDGIGMARPREFDEGRVREALMKVFWEKGYEATSMQDLVDATGLLKGSLYGAFGGKQALYMIALAHYDQTRIQAGIDMLTGEDSATEKITRLFDTVIDAAKAGVFAGGCLLCNASVEMAPVDTAVENSVKSIIRRFQAAVRTAIETTVKPSVDAAALSGFIICAYFGARVLAKAGAPLQMIVDTREQCLKDLN